METETKGNDEEEKNDEKASECLEDLGHHDDVDAECREATEEEQEVEPHAENSEGAQLPLPVLKTHARTRRVE